MNEARDYNNYNHHPSNDLSVVKEMEHEHDWQSNPPIHGSTLSKRKKLSKSKKRFYAFIVDVNIVAFFNQIVLFSYINFVNTSFGDAPMNIKNALLGNIYQMKLSTFMLTYFSYFLVSFYLGHGKTLAMTFFDLKTVGSEESPSELSFMEAFMRTLGYTVNYLLIFTPFLINLIRKDSKGLPDFFSQTEIMTEKEFLQYKHNLKMEKVEKLAQKQREEAEVIAFPISPDSSRKGSVASSPIDEDAQQLDLFSH